MHSQNQRFGDKVDAEYSGKILAMIAPLRHLLGWIVSAFGSREGLILENLAVPTKKSVLIEGVELAARRGRVQGNVRTPRFPTLLPWPLPSNSGRSARREPGTPSSASVLQRVHQNRLISLL